MPRRGSKKDSSENNNSLTEPTRRSARLANKRKKMIENNENENTIDATETEIEPLREHESGDEAGAGTNVTKDTNTPPHKQKQKQMERIKVFGIDATNTLMHHPTFVFLLFAFGHIFFSIIFASLQEFVNTIDGFEFPEFMTLIQTATYTLCAFVEMKSMRGELGYVSSPKAGIWKYVILSFLTFGGMFCTNSGLKYVSYPTRIIFKAGKPLPTMTIEYFAGRRFPLLDITNVCILTAGITLFCFGEARDLPSFNGFGIVFMSLGVILDSMTSNYEKKSIFSAGASHAEAMFFASLMGTIWTLITLIATDYSNLLLGIQFCLGNPTAFLWLILSSFGGYMSVVFIMLLIKCYNATYTECVKGMRKVLSIVVSYMFISDGNKTFNGFHAFGMGLFVFSSILSVYQKTDLNKLSLQASQFLSRSTASFFRSRNGR